MHKRPEGRQQSEKWADVFDRLERARLVMEQGQTADAEQAQETLQARARALAKEAQVEVDPADTIEVVEFSLAGEHFAVESEYVKEVYPLTELTLVPCTPSFVMGIVNIRGRILSIVDIKSFFGLPDKGITDLNKIVFLSSGEMAFGILVDSIDGVRAIALDTIQPSLPTWTEIHNEYLKGVTGEQIIILDAARILADEKIVVNETM